MSNEPTSEGSVRLSAGLDAPRWVIGDSHPDYGTVQMMGLTGGEAYRWFVDDAGCVSMIPLSVLQASNDPS